MLTRMKFRTVETRPISTSVAGVVATVSWPSGLVEAEERLAGLRAEREQLLDEIRGLSGRRNDRDVQHQIVALHLRREDIEKQIVSARKCRATALEPH